MAHKRKLNRDDLWVAYTEAFEHQKEGYPRETYAIPVLMEIAEVDAPDSRDAYASLIELAKTLSDKGKDDSLIYDFIRTQAKEGKVLANEFLEQLREKGV